MALSLDEVLVNLVEGRAGKPKWTAYVGRLATVTRGICGGVVVDLFSARIIDNKT